MADFSNLLKEEIIGMANYHLEISIISRRKGRSVVKSVNYISGVKLHDNYNNRTYYNQRKDLLQCKIFLPDNAPPNFYNLQQLCDEIDRAEIRYDARTAREFKGSLPNELPLHEQKQIVHEFISNNFTSHGLCAIAAIHEGRNEANPKQNNPHVHIIVPTRTVDQNGFNLKKDRTWDNKKYLNIWRADWANVQNIAYERNGLDIRVSHESLEVQGKYDQEPTLHISRIDYQKEQRGERTPAGDKKRSIKLRNENRICQKQFKQRRNLEIELSR